MNDIIKNGSKNLQIQVLRSVFCIMILFFHYTYRYSQIYDIDNIFNNDFIGYFSSFGVISFFILSGFYLIRRKELLTKKEIIIYWLKRFLKIYILYVISIIIIFLVSFTGLYGTERTVSLLTFFENFLFINVITKNGYVDGAHWYIFALFLLYFFAFIYDLFFTHKEKSYIYWVILLITSLVFLILVMFNIDGFVLNVANVFNMFFCNSYFPITFIGISLFLVNYDKLNCSKNIVLCVSLITVLVYYIFVDWIISLIIIFSLLIIILALFRKLVVIEKIKFLIIIGDASLSIYLLHQNIGFLIINLFIKFSNYYFGLIIALVIMIVIGIIFYYLVEKNMNRLINKILS